MLHIHYKMFIFCFESMEKTVSFFCIFYSCQIEVIDAKRKPRGFQIPSTPKEIKEVNASHVNACSERHEVRKLD